MATQTGSGIDSSHALYAQEFSKTVLAEGIVKNKFVKTLMDNGCVNKHDDLSKNSGGKVTLYGANRINTLGLRGDQDFYSNAERQEYNNRELDISLVSTSSVFRLQGTQDQQNAAFKLDTAVTKNISDYIDGVVSYSLMNQLCGTTATSLTVNTLSGTAASGSDLLTVTGNNAGIAPTYWYEANQGGEITTAAGITSSNTLTLKDFQDASVVINSQSDKPTWQQLSGDYTAIAFISHTGFNQLQNEAATLGQASQITEYYKANMAGGKGIYEFRQFMLPGIDMLFCVVPDSYMPRGVASNAEQANTRRAVIVGHNAIDMAFGRGFDFNAATAGDTSGTTQTQNAGGALAGVNVAVDLNYKPLNNEGYAKASLLWGCKKAQFTGVGANSSTAYDIGTYVIDHYSAT